MHPTSAGKQFISEVKILNSLRHPNVLQFYGVLPPMSLVMELGETGSLRGLLDRAMAKLDGLISSKALVSAAAAGLSWRDRTSIAAGIASGMAFLHSRQPPVVHRDLKPGNVIMGPKMVPKVSGETLRQKQAPTHNLGLSLSGLAGG